MKALMRSNGVHDVGRLYDDSKRYPRDVALARSISNYYDVRGESPEADATGYLDDAKAFALCGIVIAPSRTPVEGMSLEEHHAVFAIATHV